MNCVEMKIGKQKFFYINIIYIKMEIILFLFLIKINYNLLEIIKKKSVLFL
jgi:hypothetical protein